MSPNFLTYKSSLVFLFFDIYFDMVSANTSVYAELDVSKIENSWSSHRIVVKISDSFKGTPMKYAHYMRHTPQELHNELMKRNLSPLMAEHIKRTVKDQQDKLRSEKSQNAQLKLYWTQLTTPLKVEVKIIRTMLRYKKAFANEERITALTEYLLVLNKLESKFDTWHKRDKILPSVLAKEKNLPNKGLHWVDWVPQNLKDAVYELFGAIPHSFRAKHKEPFVRQIPLTLNTELRDRLYNRTLNELANEERHHLIEPSEQRAGRIDKMRVALRKIEKLPLDSPVPYTWHGVV